MILRSAIPAIIASAALSACSVVPNDAASSTSAGHGDDIGRFLSPADVPGRVEDAVAEVTKLGREEGDFFGFQRLEAYDLIESAAQPHLKSIVADVIEASRQHGDYSLAQYCLEGYDSEGRVLGFDDDNECAAHLIGHERSPRYYDIADSLRAWHAPETAEAVRMKKAMNDIQSFVGKLVGGEDMEEISISMSGLNVSEETILLINKAKGHVVIIKFDYGA